jgi:hypothetical protein
LSHQTSELADRRVHHEPSLKCIVHTFMNIADMEADLADEALETQHEA